MILFKNLIDFLEIIIETKNSVVKGIVLDGFYFC